MLHALLRLYLHHHLHLFIDSLHICGGVKAPRLCHERAAEPANPERREAGGGGDSACLGCGGDLQAGASEAFENAVK